MKFFAVLVATYSVVASITPANPSIFWSKDRENSIKYRKQSVFSHLQSIWWHWSRPRPSTDDQSLITGLRQTPYFEGIGGDL
jgi:hypothetical protein